jgi:hypothetical protein
MSNYLRWRKSSYSGQGANCVEVVSVRQGSAVRDSKDPDGPVLRFSANAWRAFVAAVKSGALGA